MKDRQQLLREVLLEALEIQDAQQRAAFVTSACGADSALCEEVTELIRASLAAGDFMPEKPAAHLAPLQFLDAPGVSIEAGSAAPIAESLGERIGRYKLLQRIGEGGCGVVYMAEQEEPVRRKVAVKVIKLGMDTRQVVARFEAERQALALMDHPNIARVLDAGATEAGRPFFIMELVRGVKITDYCDENRLSTQARLALFVSVCQAVQHAHQKGIIHRDLKPSNILVTVNDGQPIPKVIDFGIAKAIEGRLTDQTLFTAFEQFLGTPAYMSPEQAAMTSVDIDTRSDIYSLGVLLYELLTGKTPFDAHALLASGLEKMRNTIREKEPARPSTRLKEMIEKELTRTADCRSAEPAKLIHLLKGDLDWIIIKCLQKERARRYETANSLASDIRRHLNNEPVIARPPSRLYEFHKSVRRHKVGFAAAAAVIITLTFAVCVSTLEWRRARFAEVQQINLRKKAVATEQAARRESYARAMLVGYQALQASDYGLAREMLEETRAFASQDENTNASAELPWEWRHLAYETRDQSAYQLGPFAGIVQALAVSADGEWLAVGESTGRISLWRTSTRQRVAHWQMGANVVCLSFSPDGQRVAVGCVDGMLQIARSPSGKILTAFHADQRILCVRFSPDGNRCAFCSRDAFYTANIESGKLEKSEPQPVAWRADVSPDFQLVALYSEGLAFLRKETNTVVDGVVENPLNDYAHRISPDGKWLATPLADHSVQIWSLDKISPVHTLVGHSKSVNSVAWSADGRRLASGGSDQTVCVWDAEHGTLLRSLHGHDRVVEAIALSADGSRLFSGGGDTAVRAWNSLEAEPNPDSSPMLPGTLFESLTPGGRFLCTFNRAGWRIFEIGPVWKFYDFPSSGSMYGISANGQCLAAFEPRLARCAIWHNEPTGFVLQGSYAAMTNTAPTPVFSRDGRRVAAMDTSWRCEVWQLNPWKSLGQHQADEGCVFQFDPPGKRLFLRGYEHGIIIWDIESGTSTPFHEEHKDPDDHISSMDVSSDNRFVAVAKYRGTVELWSSAPGETPRRLRTITTVRTGTWSTAFSPDGRHVAIGGFDGDIQVWDLRLDKLVAVLKGHRQPVALLAFHLDDDTLISVSADEVRRWPVASR